MTIQHTPNYGIAYLDESTPLRELAEATRQTAVSLDAAMGRAGYTPPDASSFAALAAAVSITAWTVPTLLAPWVSYTANGEQPVAYRRNGRRVEFRGMLQINAQLTAQNSAPFTLPTGMRPPARRHLAVAAAAANGGQNRLVIDSTGVVSSLYLLAGNTYMVLDGTFITID